MKKILAVLLSLVVAISSTTVIFAESPEKELPTRMYGSGTYNVPANSYIDTSSFNIPDPYFAYEMCATTSSGGTSSGTYRVALRKGSGTKASGGSYIDGITYKIDWITVGTTGSHYFRITNNSSTAITVSLTYYSWT